MNLAVPRVRMFAGPNGSGKTTVKNELQRPPHWFGIYINPDELEKTVRETGVLPLEPFELSTTTVELRSFFSSSQLLKNHQLDAASDTITLHAGTIDLGGLQMNSYYASVLADFLRRRALESSKSFSFETVMSSPDKISLLREARSLGFRTYLYYVATEDPAINVQRVKNRVAEGGHDVPEDKIISRYYRSLNLLREAIRQADRAFLFDTSEEESWYFAEATEGTKLELKSNEMPNWFQPIWSRF